MSHNVWFRDSIYHPFNLRFLDQAFSHRGVFDCYWTSVASVYQDQSIGIMNITKKSCRACGTTMTAVAVCDVCKECTVFTTKWLNARHVIWVWHLTTKIMFIYLTSTEISVVLFEWIRNSSTGALYHYRLIILSTECLKYDGITCTSHATGMMKIYSQNNLLVALFISKHATLLCKFSKHMTLLDVMSFFRT